MTLTDGTFRILVCAHGHVTLEVLEGECVKFLSVMSKDEAFDLGARLVAVATGVEPVRRRARKREVH